MPHHQQNPKSCHLLLYDFVFQRFGFEIETITSCQLFKKLELVPYLELGCWDYGVSEVLTRVEVCSRKVRFAKNYPKNLQNWAQNRRSYFGVSRHYNF